MHNEYRGDIQIYRAVAVGFVLAFHLGLTGASSGFLGVDIFFVISGYLMQSLWRASDTVAGFYRRRARRLLPAYFATVFATLIAGYFIALPTEFRQLGEQSLFAATFTSNIGFWMQNSYFSKSEFNPLLHLWSLGVEIQFYLIFPLIAWMCRSRRWLLVLIAAGSLAICLLLITVSPKSAFFLLPARLWQFALGMLAATIVWRWPVWVGLAGLAGMLVVPFLPVSGETHSVLYGHPGLAAVAVSAFTAIALVARLPVHLVASRPGRLAHQLGDVSYALYLAHWPVLVFLHYRPFSGTVISDGTTAGLMTALLMVAVATLALHLLFERPGPRLYTGPRAVAAAATIAAVALMLPGLHMQGFPPEQRRVFDAWLDRAPYRCGKLFRVTHPREDFCTISQGPEPRHIMLVGDSHADSLKSTFATVAQRAGFTTHFPVTNVPLVGAGFGPEWLISEVERQPIQAVFLHFSPPHHDVDTILTTAEALRALGVEVILIGPVPIYARNVPQMLYESIAKGQPVPGQTLADHQAQNPSVSTIRSAGIEVLDTAPLFCTPVCALAHGDGRPYYYDDDHLTLTGGAVLESLVFERLIALKSSTVIAQPRTLQMMR